MIYDIKKGKRDLKKDKWRVTCRKLDELQLEEVKDFILHSSSRNRQRHFIRFVQDRFNIKISKEIVMKILAR